VEQYALGRPLIAFILPLAAVVIYVVLELLSSRSATNGAGRKALRSIVFVCVAFVGALHVALLTGLVAHIRHDTAVVALVTRGVPVLLGAAFVLVGNQMPRLRPNLAVGIRTRRALQSSAVWARVNRLTGYVAVALGLAIVGCALVIPPGPAASSP
jgi:uncharacterized membrane protein